MTKKELSKVFAERNGLTQEAGLNYVNSFLDIISDTLEAGDDVRLIGFGTFGVRHRAERVGPNPRKKGETILIPARKSPFFKAGKSLRDQVNK